MATGYRYKPMGGFAGKGRKNYDDPNDKEPPIWKTLLLVLGTMVLVLAIFAGGFVLLSKVFN